MSRLRYHTAAGACAVILAVTLTGCSNSGSPALPTLPSTSTSTSLTPTSSSQQPASSSSSKPPTSTSDPVPTTIDDYYGMDFDEVKAELSQWNVSVTKVNKVAPQAVGTIIEQDPAAGKPFAQRVTLTVAVAPPVVPDVIDMTFSEAEASLEALGFTVVENPESVIDSSKDDGTVVKQDPAPGTTSAGQVTLDVVRRPEASWLSDIPLVANPNMNVTPNSAKANAKTYTHAVSMRPSNGGGSAEYDFSRSYTQLTGELGLEDKSNSKAVAKVEILSDGQPAQSFEVAFGQTVTVDVPLDKPLRVSFNVTVTGGEATVVFGDFKAQGLPVVKTTAPTPTS